MSKFIIIRKNNYYTCDELTYDHIMEWRFCDIDIIRLIDGTIVNSVLSKEDHDIEDQFEWRELDEYKN